MLFKKKYISKMTRDWYTTCIIKIWNNITAVSFQKTKFSQEAMS